MEYLVEVRNGIGGKHGYGGAEAGIGSIQKGKGGYRRHQDKSYCSSECGDSPITAFLSLLIMLEELSVQPFKAV